MAPHTTLLPLLFLLLSLIPLPPAAADTCPLLTPSSGLACDAIDSTSSIPYHNVTATGDVKYGTSLYWSGGKVNEDPVAYQDCCRQCAARNAKTPGACIGYATTVSSAVYSMNTGVTKITYKCQLFASWCQSFSKAATLSATKIPYYAAAFPAPPTSSASPSASPSVSPSAIPAPSPPWDASTGIPCPFNWDPISPDSDPPSIGPLFDGVTVSNLISAFAGAIVQGKLHSVNPSWPTIQGTLYGTTPATCAQAACAKGSTYFSWETTGVCSLFTDSACSRVNSQNTLLYPFEATSSAYSGFLTPCVP